MGGLSESLRITRLNLKIKRSEYSGIMVAQARARTSTAPLALTEKLAWVSLTWGRKFYSSFLRQSFSSSYHRIHRNDTSSRFFPFDDQMLDSLSRRIWGIQGIHLKLLFYAYLLSKNARLHSIHFNLSFPSNFPAFTIQDCGCVH